ncbi:MAG: caspase family protein [Pirellulaceae bacterium]
MRGSRETAGVVGPFLWIVCAVFILPDITSADDGLLPPESVLPGAKLPSAKIPDVKRPVPVDLPPESTLPGEKSGPQFETTNDRLPSEADLPNFVQAEAEQEAADPPWLRLSQNGPTGPVLALHFSSDSRTLLAGGSDKQLHGWNLVQPQDAVARWMYDDAVRWQVQRGPRGEIHTIAATRDQIAFAGIGAAALTGEIGLTSPNQFRLQRTLYDLKQGPRSQILSLAASLDQVISLDSEGRLSRWSREAETGLWRHNQLVAADTSPQTRPWRMRGSSIASDARGNVYYPKLVRFVGEIPYWKIAGRLAENDREFALPAGFPEFPGGIGAMVIDPAGSRFVAADISDQGTLVAWERSATAAPRQIQIGGNVRELSISRDGRRFIASVANGPAGPFELRTWSWTAGQAPRPTRVIQLPAEAAACALSPDGNWIAYSQDRDVVLLPWDQPTDQSQRLASQVVAPVQVAFANQEDGYRLVARGKASPGVERSFEFDTQARRLTPIENVNGIVPSNPWSGIWKLNSRTDMSGTQTTYSVTRNDQPYATLPLDSATDGRVISACWYHPQPNQPAPTRLLVGTGGRNHAYLFDISQPGAAKLVREFRGHWSAIRGIGVSPDARYAVTGSDDATIRVWKLPAEEETTRSQQAWGAVFEQVDNQIVIRELTLDGPLNYRGARVGDVIRRVSRTSPDAAEGAQETIIEDPGAILETLAAADGRTMLRFEFERQTIPLRHFYLHPAWQPLVSLAVTTDQEWAYWTPYGYYDASFNGHKIFGWQFNQGLDRSPEFFLASELREQMERPRILENVLRGGSVEAAMKVANTERPADLHSRLETLQGLQPKITFLSPDNGQKIDTNTTTVEAVVDVPRGIQLVTPKLYANAVPASEGELLGKSEEERRDMYRYRWKVSLPPDQVIRLQVLASTTDGIAAAARITIENESPSPNRSPRIHLVAMGINQYADRQIPALDFATSNVQAAVATLARNGGGVLNIDSTSLVNENVTKGLWNVSVDSLLDRIQDTVQPQDVVLIFLSGHGVRDIDTQGYYFLTAEARFSDVMGRRYQHCISGEDLAKFSRLPCRKVVILDTCHSGALQTLKEEDLKTIVRTLQNDLMITITASQGDEEAFESADQRLSRFTARLVKGLDGEADLPQFGGTQDGMVTFAELARYLQTTVSEDARRLGHRQNPTVSPAELLPLVEIPLAYPSEPPSPTGF